MLHFKYRLTDREFVQNLRLNRTAKLSQWKSYLIIIVFLIPSLVIFYLLEAGWSLIWFAAMIGVLAVFGISACFKKAGHIKPYDEEFTFAETHLIHKFSHSIAQIKWGLLDEIKETPKSFQLMRLGRGSLLPKRVLGGQIEECRQLFQRVIDIPPTEGPAVELHTQIFSTAGRFPVHHFSYEQGDLPLVAKSSFRLVDNLTRPKPAARAGWMGWIILGLLTGLGSFWILSTAQWRQPDHVAYSIFSWLLPLLLFYVTVKLFRFVESKKQSRVPPDPCELRLTQTGWAIGNADGVALYDWQDVAAIYDSEHFIGFKTINQLLNLIPKRIFGDETTTARFLNEAMELHRQAKRKLEAVVATVVETGNPYQSPSN